LNNKEKTEVLTMDLTAIGAAIAAFTGIGAGVGIGIATSKAVDAVARQPEADGKIMKLLLLGCALAEATAIYGFVVAIMIILFS
jgi:F-type H+-transporting ATPase subunit c